MDYGIVIEKIHQELKAYWGKGKVAVITKSTKTADT